MRYTHDSAKLLKLLELASASPSLATNLKLQNDLDYQRLLLGQPVDLEHLRARVAGNPNEFAFRVTEAVALMKAGKNSEALGVLENIEADVDATSLPPSQMAVLAAAIAANGDQKKASALMSLCRGDFLTNEEIALVKEALANQSAASTPGSLDTKTNGAGGSRSSKTSPSPR
jgi:predicted Zn-dependent protease